MKTYEASPVLGIELKLFVLTLIRRAARAMVLVALSHVRWAASLGLLTWSLLWN